MYICVGGGFIVMGVLCFVVVIVECGECWCNCR